MDKVIEVTTREATQRELDQAVGEEFDSIDLVRSREGDSGDYLSWGAN